MNNVRPLFVESFPDELDNGILYISLRFNTAVHLCACGCGQQAVTKIAPDEWSIVYNGKEVSLYPSIGNWEFDCRSHYWIKDNQFIVAKSWNDSKATKKRKKKKKFSLRNLIKNKNL